MEKNAQNEYIKKYIKKFEKLYIKKKEDRIYNIKESKNFVDSKPNYLIKDTKKKEKWER